MTLESLLAPPGYCPSHNLRNTPRALEAGEGVQIVPGRRFPGDDEKTVQRGHRALHCCDYP